jgi:hypothetical protein
VDTLREFAGIGLVIIGVAPIVLFQIWMARRRRDTAQFLRAEANARREADDARVRGDTAAIVIPLGWNTRDDAGSRYGLQLQNYGPDIAQDVRLVARTDDTCVTATTRLVRPGEGIVAFGDYVEVEPPEGFDDVLPRLRTGRHAWMRVRWTNPDGSPGDSDWMRMQRWSS